MISMFISYGGRTNSDRVLGEFDHRNHVLVWDINWWSLHLPPHPPLSKAQIQNNGAYLQEA